MYNSESKSTIKLPEPSLRRLPWYLAYIKLLQTKGEEYVSSTQIAKEIGVDSSKIAKDLSFINISGKTRVGYEINSGTFINHIPVYPLSHFAQKQKELGVQIGILTVPIDKAQSATEEMIAGGIKAIWNFTPYRIRVPKHIVIQNTSIYAHLAVMFNRLNNIK